jgi:hypothetical protein
MLTLISNKSYMFATRVNTNAPFGIQIVALIIVLAIYAIYKMVNNKK